MKITYYGHSCIGIETKGRHLIFDPFITGNGLAKTIDPASIKADYILVSHGHQDHILDVPLIAKQSGATLIAPYEIVMHFGKQDIKGQPVNHGAELDFEFGTIKVVTALHSSSFPDGTYAGNPVGYVLYNDEGCVYFSGDTGLTLDMQLIPGMCPKVDVAILPIGNTFTMDYKDAIAASDFVECDRVLGCHYDTFDPIKIDHEEVKEAFSDAEKELHLLSIGASITI